MWKIDAELYNIQVFIEFLLQYDDLAIAHPNQAAASGVFPGFPQAWISWAKAQSRRCGWHTIMKVYNNPSEEISSTLPEEMPEDLYSFIRKAKLMKLPRSPAYKPALSPPKHVTGVTPKKLHEVFTMSTYIASLFAHYDPKPYIVDVGAGQGYLSRSLSSSPNNFHVLALDSSEIQTAGSLSRQDWLSPSGDESGPGVASELGTLTHRTIHISDADALERAVYDWVSSKQNTPSSDDGGAMPVVLVGLHCCGDLTPSILRFLERVKDEQSRNFEVVGCVVVGCCYNMCTPSAFPLSCKTSDVLKSGKPLKFETQHLHLATQSPSTWDLSTPSTSASSASMAIRKVVYRALLSRRLPLAFQPDKDVPLISEVDWRQKRVGRLAGSAYQDFPTFLGIATRKMGFDEQGNFSSNSTIKSEEKEQDGHSSSISLADMDKEEEELGRVLEVLYVLRCLLGPVVESIIALDRYFYLREITGVTTDEDAQVDLVNLFDQSTGSLRNMALVWVKRRHPPLVE